MKKAALFPQFIFYVNLSTFARHNGSRLNPAAPLFRTKTVAPYGWSIKVAGDQLKEIGRHAMISRRLVESVAA
jgi:hypothetical protein